MKKNAVLFFLIQFIVITSFSQETYVPDDNFEAYLEDNGMGNGIANDNYVTTANISDITVLIIIGEEIADFTGIEYFTNLTNISCQYNNLITLDFSNNHELEVIRAYDNHLISIQLGANTNLILLDVANNQLISLDIASYTSLTNLYINDNNLTLCNIANGNNINMTQMWIHNNPALTCIQVDDATNTPPSGLDWTKDATADYSNSCSGVGMDELIKNQISIYPNPTTDTLNLEASNEIKKIIIYNQLGQEIFQKKINKHKIVVDVSRLITGSYILKVQIRNNIKAYNLLVE